MARGSALPNQELYALLATLANTANNQPWFAPNVLHALMMVYSQDEEALAKVYTIFTEFRFLAIYGIFQMKRDQIYLMLDLGTPDDDDMEMEYNMTSSHYNFGDYVINDNIKFEHADGNEVLGENFTGFINSQFKHEPSDLNDEQLADVTAKLDAAKPHSNQVGIPVRLYHLPLTILQVMWHQRSTLI